MTVLRRVLGVTPVGHFAHRKRPPSRRTQRRDELAESLRSTFVECRRVYGSPLLTRACNARGVPRRENTVANVLRATDPPNAKWAGDLTYEPPQGSWTLGKRCILP